MVDATVDDHCSLLDPLSFHHLRFPDAHNQDVCFAHLDENRWTLVNKRIACATMTPSLVHIYFMRVNRNLQYLARHDVIVYATRWQQRSVIPNIHATVSRLKTY